jgi:hypothetical protein
MIGRQRRFTTSSARDRIVCSIELRGAGLGTSISAVSGIGGSDSGGGDMLLGFAGGT